MYKVKPTSNLEEQRGKFKQRFASLINDHLLLEEGIKDEMQGKEKVKLRNTEEGLDKIVSSLNVKKLKN